MNISGVLIRARPEHFGAVMAALETIAGVEVHRSEPEKGAIAVTLEDGTGYSVEESLLKLHLVEGISDAALVYQYSDDSLSKEAQA